MGAGTSSALLQLISAAVTPVVMISACAALILGINNKHSSIADRIRTSLAESRLPGTQAARRKQLGEQIPLFYRRYLFTWASLVALYVAVMVFTLTTLLLVFTQRRVLTFDSGTLTLFVAGVVLMLAAACFELAEI